MSCKMEMQLFDKKGHSGMMMMFTPTPPHPTPQKKLNKQECDIEDAFLYHWKQKLFLQPCEDYNEAEEDGVVRDVSCSINPNFVR